MAATTGLLQLSMRLQTSGSECCCGADDQHRGCGTVGLRRVDGGHQAAAHVHAERIDGRVVDGDDQHIGLALEGDEFGGGVRGHAACLLGGEPAPVRWGLGGTPHSWTAMAL
jgi:hypothetical protein